MKNEKLFAFPVIKGKQKPPSMLSLDEINDWIEHDYQYFFDHESYERQKKRNSVNIPFKLK